MAKGRPRKQYWDYEHTKMWVHKMVRIYNISSYKKWRQFVKEYDIPEGIPPHPQRWYGKKYISDADFLGKKAQAWVTYSVAKQYLKKFNIRSYTEYYKWHSKHAPSFIPSNPHRFYGDDWVSWGDYLGNERNKRIWRPYNEALKWSHKQGFKNVRQWHRFCKEGLTPNNIPKRPDNVYSDVWESWNVWLGKSLSSRLSVQERNTAIIFIIREQGVPDNVYTIGLEKDGLKELEDQQKIKHFKIIRAYEFDKSKSYVFNTALDENCTIWWESENDNQFLVSNIFGLTGDLDLAFKKITA